MAVSKYAVECIGTFFLMLTIALAAVYGQAGGMAPVAIGVVLIALVYMGGHVSGAHYNPAVTAAMWVRGQIDAVAVGPYAVAQVLGAAAAAMCAMFIAGSPDVVALELEVGPALVAEALFTFALCFVILNVATAETTEGNAYFGVAIGLTVMAGAFAVGSVSSAAFNPAVTMGLALSGALAVGDVWVHLLGQGVGAIGAALAFRGFVERA